MKEIPLTYEGESSIVPHPLVHGMHRLQLRSGLTLRDEIPRAGHGLRARRGTASNGKYLPYFEIREDPSSNVHALRACSGMLISPLVMFLHSSLGKEDTA